MCLIQFVKTFFFAVPFGDYGLVISPPIFAHVSPVIIRYSFPFIFVIQLFSTLEIPVIRARRSAGLIMQHPGVFIEVRSLKFAQLL